LPIVGEEAHTIKDLVININVHELPVAAPMREVFMPEPLGRGWMIAWCVAPIRGGVRRVVANWCQVGLLSITKFARFCEEVAGARTLIRKRHNKARKVITKKQVSTLEKLSESFAFCFHLSFLIETTGQALLVTLAAGL